MVFFLAGVRKSRLASAPWGPGAVPQAPSVLSPGGEQLGFSLSLLRVGSSSLQAFTLTKRQPQSHTPAPTSHRKPQGPCKARRGGGCVLELWDPPGVSLPGFPGTKGKKPQRMPPWAAASRGLGLSEAEPLHLHPINPLLCPADTSALPSHLPGGERGLANAHSFW